MVSEADHRAACDVLYREALYLDTREWDKWIDLFHEDAVFWVPTWKDDGSATNDPYGELSLIYCNSREQLQERVSRAGGGRSIASLPPMRTAHTVSNVMVEEGEGGTLRVRSVGVSHVFTLKRREQNVFFSLQTHDLARDSAGAWRIRQKKMLLQNDYIPRMIDFYTI